MTIRTKRQAESAVIAYDFDDYLKRVGYPHPNFTSLVDVGLTIYRSEIRGSVVFLTMGGGDPGNSYQAGVRCDTSYGGTITQTQTVYVSREVVNESIAQAVGLALALATGELLIISTGEALVAQG